MKNSQGYTLLKAIDCVSDDAVADAMISDDAIATASRPKRRHTLAAFFEKPAVVAAICAIVAFGTVAGIVAAGRAAGKPAPPVSHPGGKDTTPTVQEDQTDLLPTSPILRHHDLYYVSHGNGTCSLVGIAALPEDMVLTIPETAMNGDHVVSLLDMTMTSSLAVPNGVHLFQVKGIHIPATMTSVHINTLHEMTGLTELTVDEENPVYRAEKNCLIEKERERLVYAYRDYADSLPQTSPMQSSQSLPFPYFVIPDSVKIIATNALNNRPEKIDISGIIGDNIENTSAWIPISETPALIQIPASVEHIEERFFVNHDNLSINIVVSEDNPVYYAEGGCLIHKDSSTVILGDERAKIPSSVTAIAPYAFWGAGLTSIHIPASVESIGELAFWNNPDLETVTGDICAMPKVDLDVSRDGVFSCYYVQDNCLMLGEIRVTKGEITSSHTLVLGCASSVIPEHTDAIGDYAFAWNRGLTEINLPAGLQSIGFKAFAHCPNLMTLRYGSTYERWCQVAVDETWIYDNGQLAELHFSDTDIPMIVVGVEFDYSGKGKTEN